MPIVITADQRRSRRVGDRVPAVLDALNARPPSSGGRRFERTAGDEVQGVLGDAESAARAVEILARGSGWSVGLGIGSVDAPLPTSTRAGSGPAFVRARQAVEAAKGSAARLAVVTDDLDAGRSCETALMLWVDLLGRRSPAGWEVADLLAQGRSRAEVAAHLDISRSAVSQRANAAGIDLSARARRLAASLLHAVLEGGRAEGDRREG